jgi:hypothetical protein
MANPVPAGSGVELGVDLEADSGGFVESLELSVRGEPL